MNRGAKPAVPPGTLAGVMYSHSSGMCARADFSITLSPQVILETSYFPAFVPEAAQDKDRYHPSVKENVPITPAQWADVEQIILELYPLMKPVPERRHEVKPPPLVDVRDGGGRNQSDPDLEYGGRYPEYPLLPAQ